MNTWNCSRIFELQRNVNGLGLSLLASLFRGWGGLFPSQSVCWSFLGGWERTPCSTHASSLTGEVNLRRFWHVNMHTWSRIPPYHSCLRTLDHGRKPVCKSYAKHHHIPFSCLFCIFFSVMSQITYWTSGVQEDKNGCISPSFLHTYMYIHTFTQHTHSCHAKDHKLGCY